MDFLYQIFGPPHEMLHVLALRLIGRQPEAVGQRHVDIPADLTTPQYIFVAGLPAFVFWNIAAVGFVLLLNPPNLPALAAGWLVLLVGGLGGLGTLGDLYLIYRRLTGDPDTDV